MVVLLPETDDPARLDLASREFDTTAEIAAVLDELEANVPNWRVISFVHVEDLPLLMEPPTNQ